MKRLRSHAQTSSGMTIGEIVAYGPSPDFSTSCIAMANPHRRSHEIELEFALDRLHARKIDTEEGQSIGAITVHLTEMGFPTRKPKAHWERSTVWTMLRNPAYRGRACFDKTALAPRQRITRPLRLHGGLATFDSVSHEWLDQLVWVESVRLLEDPTLIQNELNRRLETARESTTSQRRLEALNLDLIRVSNSIERLLTAYQEELLPLDELSVRMP